jgi:ATP-binding cassette, subfamily B, bacterial PglK
MMKSVNSTSTKGLLVRLWHHLSRSRRRQIVLLLALMLTSAFVEVVSLSAVLPFLGILVAPEHVFNHPLATNLVLKLGISSPDQLILPVSVVFATAALVASAMRILLLWITTRLAFSAGAELGIEAYRRTLYQPFPVHISRNSSIVISGISQKVGNAAMAILIQSLTFVSASVMLVAIMLTLLAIDPLVASLAALGFGTSYTLITWISRMRVRRNGKLIAFNQNLVVKALQEGLGGIRDVLLDGTQPIYCETFRKADHPLRLAQGDNFFIGQSPRFLMEGLGMVVITGLAYMLSTSDEGIKSALPVLGALALGAQRMLPALQQIFNAWTSIVGGHASLVDAIELLDQPLPEDALQPAPPPLLFQEKIDLNAVRFRYTNDGPWVLDDFNVVIPRGARVGFVGSTGSGKSTVLDLIMGLLIPTEGALLVDGRPISGRALRAWQQTIAHVPQNIFLSDASLAENIAFGVEPHDIDFELVRKVARQAHISDFIESSKNGYHGHVGERGLRLSGGQRQRIGIARALYKQANVLVFDEATSALDNTTEKSVMRAIESLSTDLTILIIAHRLTTVSNCDIIVEMDRGRVVAQGNYEQLIEQSPSFRNLVNRI